MNSYDGGADPDGICFIDAGDAYIEIKASWLLGTLIIRTTGLVRLEAAAFLENHDDAATTQHASGAHRRRIALAQPSKFGRRDPPSDGRQR